MLFNNEYRKEEEWDAHSFYHDMLLFFLTPQCLFPSVKNHYDFLIQLTGRIVQQVIGDMW